MICPKCGFDQPDDVYCAFCGINVERCLRQKRKKQHIVGYLLIVLVGIVGFSVARYIRTVHHVETPKPAARYAESTGKVQSKDVSLPEAKQERIESQSRAQPQTRTGQQHRSASQAVSLRPEGREGIRLSEYETPRKPSLAQKKADSSLTRHGETYTAREWFEKGKALDDESEFEIERYKSALEIDPEFAPAYYRLGAIYYRRANYELADQEFAKFLKYASEADKHTYDIYVYYSPSDVERITAADVIGEAPAEEAEKATSGEAKGAEEETPTVVEETEKEIHVEVEKETEEPMSEEAAEETDEEVMTIVRFSAINRQMMVPVVLNGGVEAKVLVDTGSGITVLSGELARRLGIEGQRGRAITLKTMAMNVRAQLAMLDSIQVGDLIQHNVRVAIAELSFEEKRQFDGILGMDFMSDYEIHIDNINSIIVFSPVKGGRE